MYYIYPLNKNNDIILQEKKGNVTSHHKKLN